MRRLIASAIVSLDGCCQDAGGALVRPPWSRELGAESLETLDRCDTLLYGRVGFVCALAYWQRPALADSAMARLLVRYPKLVCSTTLPDTQPWSARVLGSVDQLRVYLRMPGNDVVVFGSPTLVESLAKLVDEVRVIVAPIHTPGGRVWEIATDPPALLDLPLHETRELPGGVVLRAYRRVTDDSRAST